MRGFVNNECDDAELMNFKNVIWLFKQGGQVEIKRRFTCVVNFLRKW